jgi:citrate synthase
VVIGTEANLHAAITSRKAVRLTSQVPIIVAAHSRIRGGNEPVAADQTLGHAANLLWMLTGEKPSPDDDPSRATAYVKEKRKAGIAVTGFGHRVYRAEDPRARHMRAGVERLSKEMGEPKWFEILQAVVTAMAPYARHGVNVNVDFYSGVVYHLLGIERDLFVPIFAIGRVPGWAVQVLEQLENNILLRPLTLYNGPDARAYVPLAQRG